MRDKSRSILVVEDDKDIAELLCYNLEKEGYHVLTAENGPKAVKIAKEEIPALILLDIMLPEMDGIEVCRQIRQEPKLEKTFIIFLTARGEEYSEVAAFQTGADDYIIKPIKPRALLKRIDALFRRRRGNEVKGNKNCLEAGSVSLDRSSYTLTVSNQSTTLPKKEFELLWLLMEYPNTVFSRQQVLDKVWEPDVEVLERTVDVHVRRVRERIGDGYIHTVKGVGYKFEFQEAS